MAVYFIRSASDDAVKIGTARNPAARLRALQIGSPRELTLLRLVEGAEAEERWLHQHFHGHRLRGEWFAFHADMLTVTPPTGLRPIRTLAVRKAVARDLATYFRGAIGLGLMTPSEVDAVEKAGLVVRADRHIAVAAE